MKRKIRLQQGSASFLRGVDISEYQPTVDWATLAKHVDFVIVRGSHGMHADTSFASHRRNATTQSIPRGFYHFFDPRYSIADQIDVFIQVVGKLNPGDLPPVLDIEDATLWQSIPISKRLEMVVEALQRIEAALGVKPIIYCSLNFIPQVLEDPSVDTSVLSIYLLWIAAYRLAEGALPKLPKQWSRWTFWQFTDRLQIPGIATGVDGDWFNGTKADLIRLTQVASFNTQFAQFNQPCAIKRKKRNKQTN